MVSIHNRFAEFVLISVMHVHKNVKNINRWIIVSSVLKHAEDVLRNVVR
jgi:hypothetical protein